MNLQESVEITHIYQALPFVSIYSGDEEERIVWTGYMTSVPSIGDFVESSQYRGKVGQVDWKVKKHDIFVAVYLET